MIKPIFKIIALIFIVQISLFAQFGKNKVQYKYFDCITFRQNILIFILIIMVKHLLSLQLMLLKKHW